ncbi:MAG: type II secretion system F family protein [Patescibacteria group bacterium]|nr:type II secretion system F family protein [Patescibacteria group bacterium]
MQFRYIASQPNGKLIQGDIEARDEDEVLSFLGSRNLTPVSIEKLSTPKTRGLASMLRRGVNISDQIFLSKYLALMLKIGTGLIEAINILIVDFDKPAVKAILLEVKTALEKGDPFYSTFARYPKIFSSVYVNLIKAGETSGNLEKTFEELTEMLTKQKGLSDKIKSSLIYPVILLVSSILVLTFIVMFALPKIANVFIEGGFQAPGFSRVVFSVGLFFNKFGFYIFGAAAIIAIAFFRFFKSSVIFKKFVVSIIGEIPVIRDVMKKIALQRFASVFSSLIRAGLPITDALEITAQAVGNINLKESLLRISKEGLAKGLTIGEAFKREPFFPMTVTNLVAISEKAGHLTDVLSTLSDFYVKEIDSSIKIMVAFLEPVLLLFIGGIIGLIALSVIIPIYQLTTAIGG